MLPETSSPSGDIGNSPFDGGNVSYTKPSSAVSKKLTICGLVLAIMALLTAIIVAGTIIPQLNDKDSLSSDADAARGCGCNKDSSDDDTITPTVSPTTTVPSGTPTTPSPTTLPPTLANETIYYPYTCECNTTTYGIINAGETYDVGGFLGWNAITPALDGKPQINNLHLSVGDKALFKHPYGPLDNVWLVNEYIYNTCDFSDMSTSFQVGIAAEVACDNRNPDECGYTFLLQDWHVESRGTTLYFISTFDYSILVRDAGFPAGFNHTGCQLGVKIKIFVQDRKFIPVVEDDGSGFDFANTDTVQDLQASIGHLSRILILQQFSIEQRIRSEGYSGLTNVRGLTDGESAYDSGTYTNGGVASIHDHSDNILLIGVGEIQAVLNGVEFQTRHNDYNLNQPSRTSSNYNAVEAIDAPDIPPSVLAYGSDIDGQILEMQEYFRAFKYQNSSHRNYKLYFQPILCYLEGTWILDDSTLSEPFDSDRHELDATTWKELHNKIRWMANSGRKNTLENLAHLPTSIRNLYNDTFPIISNWEYRILCIPLSNNIPTSRFRVTNDLHVQLMGSPKTRDELYYDRRTRFDLNKYINLNDIENDNIWSFGRKEWNYLDYLMEQIPGKDNYITNISDILFDNTEPTYTFNSEPLNAGYYNRFYSLGGNDAMGTTKHRRGWSDRYLFVAKTTQTKVSPISLTYYNLNENKFILNDESRYSYAIPLEIIYQTPLSKWNPYNITFYSNREEYNYETFGLCNISPFNGTTHDRAYWTPAKFFESQIKTSNADTAQDNVCVLNNKQIEYKVYPSGHWITFPPIGNNVGAIRQRYPIFPIHEEGNTAYKEVKAFEDIILDYNTYDDPNQNPNGFFGNNRDLIYGLELNLQGGGHQHVVYIPGYQVKNLWYDEQNKIYKMTKNDLVYVEGDQRNGHSHILTIWRNLDIQNQNKTWIYHISKCGFGTFADYAFNIQNALNNMNNHTCTDNHDSLVR